LNEEARFLQDPEAHMDRIDPQGSALLDAIREIVRQEVRAYEAEQRQQTNKAERIYTVPEVAALLGVKARTVYDWVERGRINATRSPGGGKLLFPASEVERLRRAA
jgi:excisionase family DNA binding protein